MGAFPRSYKDETGKALIQGLLNKNRCSRLGTGVRGWGEIKRSTFFLVGVSGDLFSCIAGRELKAPIIPEAERYCDEQKLLEKVTLSDAEEFWDGARSEEREKVNATFKQFDGNGDGKITRRELGRVLQKLDRTYYTNEVVDHLLTSMDLNHDGFVDYNEFLSWIFTPEARSVRSAVDLDIHG